MVTYGDSHGWTFVADVDEMATKLPPPWSRMTCPACLIAMAFPTMLRRTAASHISGPISSMVPKPPEVALATNTSRLASPAAAVTAAWIWSSSHMSAGKPLDLTPWCTRAQALGRSAEHIGASTDDGHVGAPGQQLFGDAEADPGAATGHQRADAREVRHAPPPCRARGSGPLLGTTRRALVGNASFTSSM